MTALNTRSLAGRPLRLVERNALVYRKVWFILLSGFAEPVLYLLSIGVGVGRLVGDVPGPGGALLSYKEFVAPGLMAAAAMTGAMFDTTINFFVKYKYLRLYDGVLATPLGTRDVATGEIAWGLLRGAFYSVTFLATMAVFGLVESGWAVLAVPGAVLIGLAFAGAGLAATTWMRSFIDFDYVNLAIVPMFLFSATFFPLERYPEGVQWLVRITPLYQGVALERGLVVGAVEWSLLFHAAYLAGLGFMGLRVAGTRLERLLKP